MRWLNKANSLSNFVFEEFSLKKKASLPRITFVRASGKTQNSSWQRLWNFTGALEICLGICKVSFQDSMTLTLTSAISSIRVLVRSQSKSTNWANKAILRATQVCLPTFHSKISNSSSPIWKHNGHYSQGPNSKHLQHQLRPLTTLSQINLSSAKLLQQLQNLTNLLKTTRLIKKLTAHERWVLAFRNKNPKIQIIERNLMWSYTSTHFM